MNNSEARKQLGFGYAMPIAGAALGTIVGLMLNDLLPERYDFWTWVVVQLMLGISLVIGTRSSTIARNYELKTKKHINANGARIMNFVLAIIWSAVVAIMSIGFISASVENLKNYSWYGSDISGTQSVKIQPLTVEAFVRDFLPSIFILVIFTIGTLMWLANRAREE